MIDLMTKGVPVLDWTPEPELYMNDNIHPVVRYIPEGFAGHDWWMVATPYPGSNNRVEDPILYWGDTEADGSPPLTWHGGAIVERAPGYEMDPPDTRGYNSDGCLHYDSRTKKLYVFWRVNHGTWMKQTYPWAGARATLVKSTSDGVNFSEKRLICPLGFNTTPGFEIPGKSGDAEMSPIVLERNNNIYLYGCYYQYGPNIPYGLAKWTLPNNDLENEIFTEPIGIATNVKKEFDYWHMDFCDDGKGLFLSVVTPQNGSEILLGVSNDGDNFRYYNTPLISQINTDVIYLYKAGCVIKDDIFYLFYPNRRADDGGTGPARIMMTSMPVNELLEKINNTIGKITKV